MSCLKRGGNLTRTKAMKAARLTKLERGREDGTPFWQRKRRSEQENRRQAKESEETDHVGHGGQEDAGGNGGVDLEAL